MRWKIDHVAGLSAFRQPAPWRIRTPSSMRFSKRRAVSARPVAPWAPHDGLDVVDVDLADVAVSDRLAVDLEVLWSTRRGSTSALSLALTRLPLALGSAPPPLRRRLAVGRRRRQLALLLPRIETLLLGSMCLSRSLRACLSVTRSAPPRPNLDRLAVAGVAQHPLLAATVGADPQLFVPPLLSYRVSSRIT